MKPARPFIALVSQVWTGHVPAYHQAYARALAAQGVEVGEIVFGRPASGGEGNPAATPAEVAPASNGVAGFLRRSALGGVLRSFKAWRRVARAVRQLERARGRRVDGVLFLYLDLHFLHPQLAAWPVTRVLPRPWAGLVLHPRAAYGVTGPFPDGERVLRSARCRAVAVIDDSFVPAGLAAWPGRVVVAAPDLADVSAPNENLPLRAEIRRWAGSRCVVGLLGMISAKKNAAGFVALARAAAAAGRDCCFVIAGKLSPETADPADYARHRELLGALPANCRAWTDGVEEGADFNALVAACDAVFVAYEPAPENSNVLTKAAYFQRPVLASEGHLMAGAVREFNLGEVVPPHDPAAMLVALDRLFTPAAPRNYAAYHGQHSAERLNEAVPRLLEALLS